MNIFLDLEGTVIDEFREFPTFLPSQVEDIKEFLSIHKIVQPQKVFIFSFAIQEASEGDVFRRTIQADLEKQIGREITEFIWVGAMLLTSRRVNRWNSLDLQDFIMLIGKERAFHDWANYHHRGEFSILIDDVVTNRTTKDNDHGTVIQTCNVRGLREYK